MQEIPGYESKISDDLSSRTSFRSGLLRRFELTEGDAIITTEVGQHRKMWAAQYYKYERPRQFLTSGGLGTMGYGLGAAISAKCGCPDKEIVVNIAGDGCFHV